jgi:SH3-like domain-containing protein
MNILRLSTIRILFITGLITILAMPTEAVAETDSKTTTPSVSQEKSHPKKSTKKAAKKRKAAKKVAKKVIKKASRKKSRKVATRKAVAAPPQSVTHPGKYVSAAKDGVNVRTTPSTEAKIHYEIFEKFPLLVKKRQGEWLQIADFEGDTGWIHDSLVTADKSVIVHKKRVNLRQDPNADPNNPIIAVARYGVVLTPVEKKDDWLKVRHADSTEGWLNKELVWPADSLD